MYDYAFPSQTNKVVVNIFHCDLFQEKQSLNFETMEKNVGKIDKVIRILIALVIAGVGIYYKSWWGLLAIVPLATALVGTCGLYSLLGINTCSTKK